MPNWKKLIVSGSDANLNSLDITANGTIGGLLKVADGSNSAPSITFTDDTDTGIYRSADNAFNITVGGVNKFTVNSTGITSGGNVYSGNSSEFRNYGGTWKATTGLTGNGFQFINSVDGTALTLDSTGSATFGAGVIIDSVSSHGRISAGSSFFIGGGNTTLVQLSSKLIPDADSTRDLGASNRYWKDAYIDTITTTGTIDIGGDISGSDVHIDDWGSVSASLSTLTQNQIDGSGTANYVARFSDPNTLTTGLIQDNGTSVGINAGPSSKTLYVDGTGQFTGELFVSHLDIMGSNASRLRDDVILRFGTNRRFGLRYNSTADQLQFVSSSLPLITLSGDGNVVIPSGSLSISGDGANTVTLTESGNGDFTIDAPDDIRLDAGGGDVVLRADGVEYGRFGNYSSGNLGIRNTTQDKDIILKGNDGGTTIDALTLDMSAKGKATFSGNGQFYTTLTVNAPDEGASPANTSILHLKGYEGRGAGIRIQDSKNSASNPSNREWFIGSGYAQSGFNIGYASDGSQSSYTAQNILALSTSGDATFTGATTSTKVNINQAADEQGLEISGYDDHSSSNIKLQINSSGHARLSQTTDGSSGYLFLQAENYLQLIAGTFIYTQNTVRIYDNAELQFGNSGDYKISHKTSGDKLIIQTDDNKGITIDNAGNATFSENVVVEGSITAQEFHTEFVSASIIYESGSTKFGDTNDDKHNFTGSVRILGGDENTLFLNTNSTGQQTTIFYQVNGSYEYQQRVGANYELYNYSTSNWDFHIQGSTGYLGLGNNNPKTRLHLSGSSAAAAGIRQSRDGVKIWTQEIDSNGKLQWAYRATEAGSATQHLTLNDTGQAILNQYGSGNYTGTLAYTLGVDSSGNIIESTGGGGGGAVSSISNGANNRVAVFSGTDTLDGDAGFTFDGTKLTVEDTIAIQRNGVSAGTSTLQQTGTGLIINAPSGYHPLVLQHNTTELLRLRNDGKLGVGIVSPSTKFQVKSGGADDGIYLVQSGNTNLLGGIIQTGTGDGAIVARNTSNAQTVLFRGQGNNYLTGGSLGIGTTSPDVVLHVESADETVARFERNDGSGFTAIDIKDGAGTTGNSAIRFSDTGGSPGEINYEHADNSLRINTNSGERLRITSTGAVGINTTSPNEKLHVGGTSRFDGDMHFGGAVFGQVYRPVESSSATDRYFLMFDYTNNASYPFLTNRTPNGAVVIKTGTAAGGGENEHFRIKGGDGTVDAYFTNTNVGIGTATPGATLDVHGRVDFANDFRLRGTDSAADQGVARFFVDSNDKLFIDTGNDGSNRFVIGGDGSVGIGTEAPGKHFHLYHSSDQLAQFESSDASAKILIKDPTTTAYINANNANASFGPFSSYSSTGNIRIVSGSEVHTGEGVAAFGGTPSGNTKWRVQATVDTSADSAFNNSVIDLNVQGSTAVTNDRNYRGLYIDLDSSATGGDLTNEVRLYGQYVSIVDSGDADLNHGIEVINENRNSDASATMSSLLGIRGTAKAANTQGTINNMYGVDGNANLGSTTGGDIGTAYGVKGGITGGNTNKTPGNVYAGFFKVDPGANFASTLNNSRGVYSEVEIDGNTTTSTVHAYQGVIDLNSGSHDDLYQLRLDTQIHANATHTGENYGIYSQGAERHLLIGKTLIGNSNAGAPGADLHIYNTATSGFVGIAIQNGSTSFDNNISSDGLSVGINGNDAYFVNRESADIYFFTNDTNTNGITIKSGGNIGLGTVNPGYQLDVAGDINTSTGLIRRAGNAIIKSSGAETMVGPGGSGIVSFHNSATMTTSDETMRIDANGNLLLNNTSAGARLDIREDSNYAIRAEDASGHYFRVNTGGDTEIRGDLTVQGTVVAQEFHTEFVSASIIYESGSTKFGDTTSDNHDFTGSVNVSGSIHTTDNSTLKIGNASGGDLQLYHNGSHSLISNQTGNLYIRNQTNDGDILFQGDDGSGGDTTYFFLDGSSTTTQFYKTVKHYDAAQLWFGDGNDFRFYHNGTNSNIDNYTGNLDIIQRQDDGDIRFYNDNGSGGTAEYLRFDGGITSIVASKDLLMGVDGDGGKIKLGASQDLQIYHSGTHSFIDGSNGVGSLYIRPGNGNTVQIEDKDGNDMITAGGGGAVNLYYNGSQKFKTENAGASVTGNFYLSSGNFLHFDNGGSNNYYVRKTGTTLEFKTGGTYNFLSGNAAFAGDIDANDITIDDWGSVSASLATIVGNDLDGTGDATKVAIWSDADTLTFDSGFRYADDSLRLYDADYAAIDIRADVTEHSSILFSSGSASSGRIGWHKQGYFASSAMSVNPNNAMFIQGNHGFDFTHNNTGSLSIKSGSADVIIDSKVNLGIGAATPADKVHVGSGNILVARGVEYRSQDTGGSVRTLMRVNSSNELEYGWSGNGPVKFMGGGSYTERMRIHTNGRVGIGTTAPNTDFHVSGEQLIQKVDTITAHHGTLNIKASVLAANSNHARGAFINLQGAAVSSNSVTNYDFVLGTHHTGDFIIARDNSFAGGYDSGSLKIDKDDLTVTVEKNLIVNENVGIGTTGPKQQFHVHGGSSAGSVTKAVIGGTGGNGESYLYLAEHFSGDNVNYGFSFVADGNSTNNLLIKRHSNSTSGATVLTIERDASNATFHNNLTALGSLTIGDSNADSAQIGLKHLLGYCENTDVDTGTETIKELALATYQAVFFDYVVKNGTNLRAGTVTAVHDGTNVEFTDTSTKDLGSTSAVTLSVDINGSNMRLRATTTSDNWIVKANIRGIKV